ncbi:MAG: hypothetical protein VXV94_09600 [Cyanobacteriota bacterium]|nr:hypothetical protein [Cyanobacteriota bacterium]
MASSAIQGKVQRLWVFAQVMYPDDEIVPVVLVAVSVVVVLVILAFNNPGTFECVGACG